jgi:hypothetical protein
MTELRDPKTPNTTQPAAPRPGGEDSDALHHLYRMSRTAGLGSGDYVAINNTAIVALILGCASVLSLLYPIMLVAAAAAVVCGVMALVQIRNSNGTQSGRAFAALGILLGLALGGIAAGKMGMAKLEKSRDEQAIDAVVKQLSEKIVAKDYAAAYSELFTDEFKQSFTQQGFADRWESFVPVYGTVKQIDWGRLTEIQVVAGTKEKRAFATSLVHFDKFQDPARQPMNFVEREGKWLVDGIGQLFEKPRDSREGAPAMPDPSAPLGPELMVPDNSAPQQQGPTS